MARFSNSVIERMAVNAINSESVRPGFFLKADIPVGDKAPSFDGIIMLFKDGSEKKDSYVNDIPVQVKGTMVKKFSGNTKTFKLEMDHYKNFYKRGGCLLLVVEISDNQTTRIFYKQLLAIELREIIKNYGGQKTYTVKLRTLEETNLYRVCSIFSNQMKKQPPNLVETNKYVDSDFNVLMFASPTYSLINFEFLDIFEHDFYQYGVKDNIEIPLRTVQLESISLPRTDRIKVGEEEIEANIELIFSKSRIIKLCIENTLEIEINSIKNTFNINTLDVRSIESQIKILKVLKNIFITGNLGIQGLSIEFGDQSFEEELAKLDKELIFWSEAIDVFNSLQIDVASNFSNQELVYHELKRLHQMLVLKNYKGITPENPETASFFKYYVGGLYIVLFYNPDSKIKFVNPFTKNFIETSSVSLKIMSSEKRVNISPFLLLEDETLREAVNLNFELINESYELIDFSQIYLIMDIINEFCLRCINAYDETRNTKLLETVLILYKLIEENDDKSEYRELIFVNRMQTILRLKGSYSLEEKSQIINFKIQEIKNKEVNVELLFCLDTLLSNSVEAKYHFESLSDTKKSFYKSLPIFSIYNML